MAIKIAIIGAGSIGFTRKLMHDILAVPEMADTFFHFMDISERNLAMMTQLAQRDIEANQLPARIEATLDQREAIADSDYVISVIRQGGLEAFALDVAIPLKYGVDQCVGDTICAGGIMYAQRTIPALLSICCDIQEVAQPECLFLNYSNPMAMNVWACNKYGEVPTLGLCHGVQAGHGVIAACTESNGHLSEYLPWYRKRPSEIESWIDHSSWINGATGGYLRHCQEERNWFETAFPNWLGQQPPVIEADRRSEEHGSYIIESLETGRPYRGHFNVINQGHITNLPNGCVIEIPGYVDRNGIHMPVVGELPLACAATCAASVRVQEMGMEAAVHGDVLLLKQAMLHDPLVGAVCNPAEVWQMTDEMLAAQAQWLPQYQEG